MASTCGQYEISGIYAPTAVRQRDISGSDRQVTTDSLLLISGNGIPIFCGNGKFH